MLAHRLSGVTGLVIGASFFLWIAGPRLISPVETDWVMKLDWRIHFLGWHIFRSEPWSWPPGAISGYYHAPTGTSIGYTDSIPLVALPLKAVSRWLPMPTQYLGPWLLACFTLQGLFGVLLARLWTRSSLGAVLSASMFVLVPTLLNRAGHPALCAHWTLLWALWLYFRWQPRTRLPMMQMAALTTTVSLIHPYLAVMVAAIEASLIMRFVVEGPGPTRRRTIGSATAASAALAAILLAGWWASGLFLVTAPSMARPGLTLFSMNLLAPITPQGWSSLLPAFPIGAGGQAFEGFQYFGAGIILLMLIALLRGGGVSRGIDSRLVPILCVCGLMAVYALSPRVTLADRALWDWNTPQLERLAVFGVTGRFFWPATYLMLSLALATVWGRFSRVAATAILAAAVCLQAVDLRPAFAERRALTRDPAFYQWAGAPRSAAWEAALPHYRHIVLYYPLQCGVAPVTFELPGYLAGLYGLTMNVGEVARAGEAEQRTYCADLEHALATGEVRDDSIYLVHPALEPQLRQSAPALVCGSIDDIRVCTTSRSYQPWRGAAELN